jgi:hypothetical protein
MELIASLVRDCAQTAHPTVRPQSSAFRIPLPPLKAPPIPISD